MVAYVDNPPQGASTSTDNPGACGLIVVSGSAAQTPIAPDDSAIRTAITADGGAGSVAYYVMLGSVLVASGTTDIDSTMITAGSSPVPRSYTKTLTQNAMSGLIVNYAVYGDLCIVTMHSTQTTSVNISNNQNLTIGTLPYAPSTLGFLSEISAVSNGDWINKVFAGVSATGLLTIQNKTGSAITLQRVHGSFLFKIA